MTMKLIGGGILNIDQGLLWLELQKGGFACVEYNNKPCWV